MQFITLAYFEWVDSVSKNCQRISKPWIYSVVLKIQSWTIKCSSQIDSCFMHLFSSTRAKVLVLYQTKINSLFKFIFNFQFSFGVNTTPVLNVLSRANCVQFNYFFLEVQSQSFRYWTCGSLQSGKRIFFLFKWLLIQRIIQITLW